MLSERISTWCPIRSGRKNWQARQTASISKQLMWKPLSAFDQLAHGVLLGPAGKTGRLDKLLAFPSSWCGSRSPPSTNPLRRSVCLRTAPPNLCWWRLSWQLSWCGPTPWPRPSSSTVGSSRGSGLSHRPDSPWYASVRDAMRCVEPGAHAEQAQL